MLSTLDSLKREDFAIGVVAVALGVGAAQVATQVSPSDTEELHQKDSRVDGVSDSARATMVALLYSIKCMLSCQTVGHAPFAHALALLAVCL